ncbi:MAG TPA: S8/S53 family peptidase, partial [Acidimicrobiales bacterium]|nr:S8/S53 family peptidase [Acidimicrobiales bacterium]
DVTVAVVDSGVPADFQQNPLLGTSLLGPPAVSSAPSEDEPWLYSGPVPVLVFPQGHGSFVAGVVRQAASGASVRSYRALDTDGVTDEWYLGYQLALVLEDAPQVINLSLGTPTRADERLMGLAVLERAITRSNTGERRPAPIVVAAAGNLGDSRPFYPAADKWTISVGAVELTGPDNDTPVPASFSNFGPWVDVCAKGARVFSAYEHKPYRPLSAPSSIIDFKGFALWNGTSFAAPHVSGVVAELLSRDPHLGLDGVRAILEAGPVKVPNLGTYVQ